MKNLPPCAKNMKKPKCYLHLFFTTLGAVTSPDYIQMAGVLSLRFTVSAPASPFVYLSYMN